MVETFKRLIREITLVTDESLILSLSVLSLIGLIAVIYWTYNRRKFHKLSHQIPASVLKSYLDSIIQNSTSLKSSLFRGGGLDIGEGVPSVLPTSDLPSTTMGTSEGFNEAINIKNAEIATLHSRIAEKEGVISDLEKKVVTTETQGDGSEVISSLNERIDTLEKDLAEALAIKDGEEGTEDSNKLADMTQERDELKERLMEYEVIEEDLANLKKLQQENEQLKKSLESMGAGNFAGTTTEASAITADASDDLPKEKIDVEATVATEIEKTAKGKTTDEISATAESKAEEVVITAETEEVVPVAESEEGKVAVKSKTEEVVASEEAKADDQKSAEELLSEFEKMLG